MGGSSLVENLTVSGAKLSSTKNMTGKNYDKSVNIRGHSLCSLASKNYEGSVNNQDLNRLSRLPLKNQFMAFVMSIFRERLLNFNFCALLLHSEF